MEEAALPSGDFYLSFSLSQPLSPRSRELSEMQHNSRVPQPLKAAVCEAQQEVMRQDGAGAVLTLLSAWHLEPARREPLSPWNLKGLG